MLVLSRKQDEEIVVEGPCVIKIISMHGNRVRVGIQAEKDVRILRREVIDRDEVITEFQRK
jgi:carbon storage regulator